MNTGNKTLVESSYDKIWGTGIPLSDPACLDRTKWYNPGIMSKLLMDIRQEVIQGHAESGTTNSELMDVTGGQPD